MVAHGNRHYHPRRRLQRSECFAAPGAVRVALGPAGESVVENISLPAGSSITSPAFQGKFRSWFADGGQFLTSLSTTVWVYSADGTQQDIRMLSTVDNLGGLGNWFWTSRLNATAIYKVGASATPAATFAIEGAPIPSGDSIALLEDVVVNSVKAGVVHIIDLSGATPVMTDYASTAHENSAYAAISNSQWVLGNVDGTVIDGASLGGPLKHYGYGRVTSDCSPALIECL